MNANAHYGQSYGSLVNSSQNLPEGINVQVFKCPNDYAKINSPLCWGIDINVSP